jgi:lauroyl/myristoyl acyltransferase
MSVDLQQILNSPFAVQFVSMLARMIPPGMAYPLCDGIGNWIASRKTSTVRRVVRTNQWVARGANLEEQELDCAVRQTFQNNARDIYTLYHNIHNPNAMQCRIVIHPRERALVERPEFTTRGLVIVGLHLSNFDFVLQSLCQQGFKGMVLTIPNPQGGRRVEYEMRKKMRMNLVPASMASLRQVLKHLERGGTILTGADHPVQDPKHCPKFFGYAASLPTHYISLALKANVPIVIMAATQHEDGNYHVMGSEPIEMEHDRDHDREIVRNAENVLKQAEAFIQMAPEQWNVPLPVWPELLDITPG